jgi:hypothetical protein
MKSNKKDKQKERYIFGIIYKIVAVIAVSLLGYILLFESNQNKVYDIGSIGGILFIMKLFLEEAFPETFIDKNKKELKLKGGKK